MAISLSFPQINGNRFDFTSIEIVIAGVPYRGVRSINYKHSTDRKKIYGTSAQALGRTRGPYTAEGSFEMYKEDYDAVTTALYALGAGGYGEAPFQIVVAYADTPSAQVINDSLVGCIIKGDEDGHSQGNDGLIVKADLDIMQLLRNGKPLLNLMTMSK